MVTYNRDIPDANNNPSADQPKMKTNTNAIDDIFAVDHVSFNVSNGGQHTSISFNQGASYVPVPPVSPPELFTDLVDALAQLKYYSGTAAQSSNQYTLGNAATNFSTFLFGGLILKGGTFVTSGAATTVVTYTALAPAINAFPNNTKLVVITPIDNNAINSKFGITAKSATGFTWGGTSTVNTYYFLAIGN